MFKILRDVLAPFSVLTEEVSSSTITVSYLKVLMVLFTNGMDNLGNLSVVDPTLDSKLVVDTIALMKTKFNKYRYIYDSYEVFACVILDPRFKLQLATSLWHEDDLQEFTERLKDEIDAVPRDSNVAPPTGNTKSISALLKRILPPQPVSKSEFDKYNADDVLPLEGDIFQWWFVNQRTYPSMARVARRYLPMQATSVDSERLFSIAGHLVSPRRTRMTVQTVRNLICLRSWLGFVPYNASDPGEDSDSEVSDGPPSDSHDSDSDN
jgi:hypothetical protein